MNPYVGQILQFCFGYAPEGFLACDGSLVSISQYDALYSVIGTTYGGDGNTTFALPNLIGRAPISQGVSPSGTSYVLGQTGGTASVTLNSQQLPSHGHQLNVVTGNSGGTGTPGSQVFVADEVGRNDAYAPGTSSLITMNGSVGSYGGNGPHSNVQPVLAILFCIAWSGIYPVAA